MSQAQVRAPSFPPVRLIFDGQSHNLVPIQGGILGNPYPWHLTRGRGEPWGVVAISGANFEDLTETAPVRLFPCLNRATVTVLLLSEGTADVQSSMTAQGLYDAHVTYANDARLVDPSLKVVVCNLIGSVAFDAGEEAKRLAFNDLLVSGAAAFDGVADCDAALTSAYGVDYWDNDSCLWDGVHMLGQSARAYAVPVSSALATALSA